MLVRSQQLVRRGRLVERGRRGGRRDGGKKSNLFMKKDLISFKKFLK